MKGINASEMVDTFISTYAGMFGTFVKDAESSSTAASALAPDGANMSVVRFEVVDDVISEFAKRKALIESKQRRLGPMGEMRPLDRQSDCEDSFGRLLNFDLLGQAGGFLFYAAYKDRALMFIQAYSTTGRGQISDSECENIIECACKAF